MTTPGAASAAPMEIRLGGQFYRMSPLCERDIAELDNWLRARLIRLARASLPPEATEDERRLTLSVAFETASTLSWMSGHGAKMISTLDGLAQLFWQGLKTLHPELTPEKVLGLLLDPQALEEARQAFDRLNVDGAGLKKTSDGKAAKRKHR